MKMSIRTARLLFGAAALYDGLIAGFFLVSTDAALKLAGAPEAGHPGYFHFPAAMLLIFAYMFLRLALAPIANYNLIQYGILLKIAYSGTVAYHALTEGVGVVWLIFAGLDLLFLIAFAWALLGFALPPAAVEIKPGEDG